MKIICPGIYQKDACINIDLSLYFSRSDALPAKVIIDSINGMNLLLRESKQAIAELLGIENVCDAELYLQTVRNGSKIEDFIFKIFLGSDQEAQHTAEELHKRFGVNKLMESRHIQNTLIVAIVAYLIGSVCVKYIDAQKAQAVVTATNSVIINTGRDLNIAPAELTKVIESAIPNGSKACKGALLALQPATLNDGTIVKFGGSEGAEIPSEMIRSMPPPSVIVTKPQPMKCNMDGVRINVMASDIDRRKTGWAVRLPTGTPFSEKRIHAELDPTINPADLMYRQEVVADITIYQDDKGCPKQVLIRAIQ